MKSVLLSIQPYWVFLIIAKAMGWNIGKEKTEEVRKNYPKAKNWDKTVKIYCSKDKKSFAKIPKEAQPLMQQFLGRVIGEFVCDKITVAECGNYTVLTKLRTMLDDFELLDYADEKTVYGWHISKLIVYDKPKDLSEFHAIDTEAVTNCEHRERIYHNPDYTNGALLKGGCLCKDKQNWCSQCKTKPLTNPPQSWGYVEVMT